MTRSKLENYLRILEALVAKPLEFEIILYQVDQNWKVVKKYLDFLISHGLIDKLQLDEKRVVYAITEKGCAVLNALQVQESLERHRQPIPIYED